MKPKVNRTRWTPAEIARMKAAAQAGQSTADIARMLGRSEPVVRRMRLDHECAGRVGVGEQPMAPVSQRVQVLQATIDRAMAERRVDWDLVDQLIGGWEYLKSRGV